MALEEERKSRSFEKMECVARLVQKGAHVAVHRNRVHEYERHLSEREGLAVGPGGLALSVFQVEQVRVGHAPVVDSKLRIDLRENCSRAVDEGGHIIERLQSGPALRVRGDVPGPKRVEVRLTAASLHQ